jgi:hypothetical protein
MHNIEYSTDGGLTFHPVKEGNLLVRVSNAQTGSIQKVAVVKATRLEVEDDPYGEPEIIYY